MKTWKQFKQEEQARRIAFGKILMQKVEKGETLRNVAVQIETSHEQVRLLINKAKEAERMS